MRPLRIPFIQNTLSWALAGWMRLCFSTIRWTHENQGAAEEVWAAGGGVICAFWHSRVALSPACWPLNRAQPTKALISLSPDGQFIAKAVGRLGFPAIRGSSAKKEAPERAKGGSQAFREALRQLKTSGLAITPDGPRGPARQMAEGMPTMARIAGVPVLMVGLSCKPAIKLDTWDQALVPLPFGRGAIVWDVARYPEGEPIEAVVAAWTERMNAVEARANAIVAGQT